MQMRVADFLVKPVPPVELVARLRARRQGPGQYRADRGADFHLPARGRRRRRDHARGADRDAAAQQRRARQDRDLPRRSRLPARRLRRLSRHRAAPQSRRDRAAPGAARSAIARSDALASSFGPGRDRGAEPSRGNALVRSRRGDAAARSGLVAFRLSWCSTCRAPGSPGPTACCSAPTGCSSSARRRCRACATPSSWSRPSASGSATGRSRRSSSIASSRRCSRPACAAPISSRRSARRSPPAFPTITRWCARRSTAAFRSTRSSPATRSRSSSRSSILPQAAGKAGKEAAAGAKKFKLSWARS